MSGDYLIYDGDCGFCTQSAKWLERHSKSVLKIRTWQSIDDLSSLGLTLSMVQSAAYFVENEKVIAGGSDAIAAGLRRCGLAWRVIGRTISAPVLRIVARRVYKVVARNRHKMPGSTDSCEMPK